MGTDEHLMTGVYAVDAFADEGQRIALELHLRSCEECRSEARSLRETAAVLSAHAAVPAPRSLRDSVFEQIARTPQERPLRFTVPGVAPGLAGLPRLPGVVPEQGGNAWAPRHGRDTSLGRVSRVLAAAAALVVLGGVGLAAYGVGQLDQARQARVAAIRLQTDSQRVLDIAADPRARRASVEAAGGGTATLVSAGAQAVLVTEALPDLPAGRTYQLWLVGPHAVVSAGLGPDSATAGPAWNRLVTGIRPGDAVAISIEPAGGSRQPTTTPIAVLQV